MGRAFADGSEGTRRVGTGLSAELSAGAASARGAPATRHHGDRNRIRPGSHRGTERRRGARAPPPPENESRLRSWLGPVSRARPSPRESRARGPSRGPIPASTIRPRSPRAASLLLASPLVGRVALRASPSGVPEAMAAKAAMAARARRMSNPFARRSGSEGAGRRSASRRSAPSRALPRAATRLVRDRSDGRLGSSIAPIPSPIRCPSSRSQPLASTSPASLSIAAEVAGSMLAR